MPVHALRQRQSTPERMDDPGLDAGEHDRALRGLARINWWSRSAAVLWPSLLAAAPSASGPVRVLDVATGAGDVPVGLWRRAQGVGVEVQIAGCDISPTAVAHASRRARQARVAIDFFQHDLLRDPLPRDYDLVTCSLFLHHLGEDDAVVALRQMANATRRRLAVADLIRSPLGYSLAWAGTRLLSRSSVVHFDGPASVRSAFTVREVRELAARAGLVGATITTHWPFRFLLTWSRA